MTSTARTACPAGFYSSLTGQTSIGTCVVCPEGSYCLNAGTAAPVNCPANYVCPQGTIDYTNNPCPTGTYSDTPGISVISSCTNCTEGYYCPGDSSPIPCPAGRYNTLKGVGNLYDCRPCEPGYACTSAGMSSSVITTCAAGYYCPSGTPSATEYPCPAGRFSDSVSLSGYAQCTLCTEGYTCIPACKSSDKVQCTAGHYCPEGTANGQDIPCPAGTYTASLSLFEETQCSSCPAGFYCAGGESSTSGACAAGYYCPVNTTASTDNPCAAGRWSSSTSLEAADDCDIVDPGYYAVSGSSGQSPCPAGKYSTVPGTEDYYASAGTTDYCLDCTAGYYCPAGSSDQTVCGTGYYSATGADTCIICPSGTYCADTITTDDDIVNKGSTWDNAADLSGVCFNGTLCPSAGRTTQPDLAGDACPAGYYCPSGSSTALACPSGTYSPFDGKYQLADCITSPAGYYSLAGTTATAGLCYPGYYCEAGSSGPMALPCLPGTYRAEYGGTASSDCGTCPTGSYCPIGSSTPLLCPRGYYCPAGISEPEPCAPGRYGNVAGLHQEHECTECDPGYYCSTYGLQAPTGLCSPGFYCLAGQNTSTPRNAYATTNTTSDVCPPGSYCPLGTILPIDCPLGTFNPSEGGTSTADCTTCTAGMYCEGLGNIYPDGDCIAGYYCTGGSDTPTQFTTEAGYYTIAGSAAMIPCSVGTYQDHTAQSACTTCPQGYYCPVTAMNNVTSTPCPRGEYCVAGSVNPAQCGIGKYSPNEGNVAEADCLDCPAGYYCDSEGQSASTGQCTAGYYCTAAATMAVQATDSATGGRCPTGAYCEEGTGAPVLCPAGTYMATEYNTGANTWNDLNGDSHSSYCTPCDNGMACTAAGLTAPDATCAAGYWCNLEASIAAADCTNSSECGYKYDICPQYYHCPAGSSEPVTCAPGYYTATNGQSACIDCPTGYYCDGTAVAPVICPAGSYCPIRTTYSNEYTCPVGRYSSTTGLNEESECAACEAGYYCPTVGSGATGGECDAGYFCGGGSSVANPEGVDYTISYVGDTCVAATNDTENGRCPPGHYCEQGSTAPVPCPPGKLSPATQLTALSECPNCTAGHYCPYSATIANATVCPAGAYCPSGSEAFITCPAGYYCPEGSADKIACGGGYYQPSTAQDAIGDCVACNAGYYCPEASTAETACPVGRYCGATVPIGTYCVNGTYGTTTGMIEQADCTDCPEKKYCHTGAIQGDCSAGYFCKGGSDSATPDQNITQYNDTLIAQVYFLKAQDNAQCPPGYYCPEGNTDPIACPDGTVYEYTTASSADDCGDCPAGYYCLDGTPTPVMCDLGSYCPYGTTIDTQQPCPRLTYGASRGLISAAQCTVCPAGYACNSTGIADYEMWPCPVGYYCPEASNAPQPCPGGTYMPTTGANHTDQCITCPNFHYCPAGSSSIFQCPQGYYCSINSEIGTICPAGYYCPTNTTTPLDCPDTYYCPAGSFAPNKCWVGTYCPQNSGSANSCPLGYIGINATGTDHLDSLATACEACAAGKYGADPDRLVCSPGTAGYLFYGGTTSATPQNVTSDNGEPCPPGYYCPANATEAIACPAGTYNPTMMLTSESACLNCPTDSYSNQAGASSCSSCSSSSAAVAGATECVCKGNNRAFQPNDGFCICKPGYEFVDVDFTVQSEEDGTVDCQPIVYDRCTAAQTRNDKGVCVDTYSSCDTFCSPYSGEIGVGTGLCICDKITPLAEVCDSSCRSAATVVTCQTSTTILLTYDGGATESVGIAEYTPSSGSIDCTSTGSQIVSMTTTDGGFKGVFGAPATISAVASRRRRLLEDMGFKAVNRSSLGLPPVDWTLQGSASSSSIVGAGAEVDVDAAGTGRRLQSDSELSNPAVCVKAGDSIVFDVSSSSYPVYVKDSLVNTNDDFDYSGFRDLKELATSSSLTVSSFAFTFSTAGNYVFQLSDNTDMVTIISVVDAELTCGTDSVFDIMSAGTLVTLGVSSNTSIVLAPDWALLIGLILGIVILVVLIVSFMYYFRKRAWVAHMDMPDSYRRKVPGGGTHAGEPKASKGGLFSDRAKSKVVPAITDFDEDARGPDVAAEVERAMELQEYADVDFDDDMLIPELAKHVQAQHDDVAARLDRNEGEIKGLHDTFTKEVDDLKALLNSTALQMTSAGGSEAAKVKKLRALLLEVKKNTADRSAFAGYCAITETKLSTLVGGIRRLIDIGADKTAIDIVEELNDEAVNAFDKGETEADDYPSSIYASVEKDLLEIKAFYEEVLDAAEGDVRAVKIADAAFEEGLELAHVAFPQNIRSLMTVASQAMVEERATEGQVWDLLKAFVDRAPRFTYAMNAAKGVLCRSLKTHIEEGRIANADEDRLNTRNEMAGYLNDLIAALLLVQEKLAGRVSASEEIRDDANTCRTELMAAIDAELGFLSGDDNKGDVAKLIKALKEGGLAAADLDDDEDEDEDEGDDEEEEDDAPVSVKKSVKKSGKRKREEASSSEDENNAIDDDHFDVIDENDKIDATKKEELLAQAQNDKLLANSTLAREEQAKKEMLASLQKEQQEISLGGDDDGDVANDEEDLQALQKSQEASRDDKLKALERAEYSASLAAGDSPHDVRVSTIATNRYVAIMRCLAAEARVSYYELAVQFTEKRAKAGAELIAKNGSKYTGANANYVKADAETTNGAVVALLDYEAVEARLDKEEAGAAVRLRADTKKRFDAAMGEEDKRKESWLADPAAINASEEAIKLRTQCLDNFKQCHARMEKAVKQHAIACAAGSQLQVSILDIKSSVEGFDDEKKAVLHRAFEKEQGVQGAAVEQSGTDLQGVLTAEEASLSHILTLVDSWGPTVDSASLQRELFERRQYDVTVEHDTRTRLAKLEQYYRNEMVQISTESELNRRAAEQKEVQIVFSNLEEGAAEASALLEERLGAEGQKKVDAERERQEQSVSGYEAERYLAVADSSHSAYQLGLDVQASLRSISAEMSKSMEKKKGDLIMGASQQEMTDEVKKLSMQQLDEEHLMTEASLHAAYSTITGQAALTRRLSAEVMQGAHPSVDWGAKEIDEYTAEGLAALTESVVHNAVRRRYKRRFSVARTKVYENFRLMSLDRNADELDKIYDRLDENLSERLGLIEAEYSAELGRVDGTQADACKEMKAAHADFQDEVYMVLADSDTAIADHEAAMRASMEEVEHAEGMSEEERERSVLSQGQDHARLLGALLVEGESKVYAAFKRYHARVFTLEKMQDDLRKFAIDTLQNAEALENALDNERNAKFRKLLAEQIAARNKQRELRDAYEMELKGLASSLGAKRDKQKKFLADRLARRRKKRENELIDSGMDVAEAKAVAAAEAAAEQAQKEKSIDDGIEEETMKARRRLISDKDELENDVMDKYKKALKLSEDGLSAAKKREKDALAARLKARRAKRVAELIAGGMSEAEAKKQADKELKTVAQAEAADIESGFDEAQAELGKAVDKLGEELQGGLKDGLRDQIAAIKADGGLSEAQKSAAIKQAQDSYSAELARLKEEQERARRILESGLEDAKRKERQALQERLAKKKRSRVAELKQQGKGDAEASQAADAEGAAEQQEAEAALESHYKVAKTLLESAAADDWNERMAGIKTAHENKLQGLESALEYNKGVQSKCMADRLQRRKNLRKQMLAGQGLSQGQVQQKLAAEFKRAEEGAEEGAVEQQMRADLAGIAAAKTDAIERMDAALAREEGAQSVSSDDDVVKMLERQLAEAKQRLEEASSRATAEYTASSSAAKDSTEKADDELRNLRAEHDAAVSKLQDGFDAKRKEQEAAMKRKLAMRKKKKEALLRNQNENKVAPNAAPIEVAAAVEGQAQEASQAVQQDLRSALEAINSDATLSAEQKKTRVAQAEADYAAELARLKQQAARAKQVLEDGFANSKDAERKRMAARLKQRQQGRQRELASQGKSQGEAAAQAQAEAEQQRSAEEAALDEDFAEAKAMIEGASAPALSAGEMEQALAAAAAADEGRLRAAQELERRIAEETGLAELNRQQAELEGKVVQREQAAAAAAADKAAAAEDDAQKRLAVLKEQQEAEMAKLQASMTAAQRKKSDDLKRRLADKKAAKMKQLEAAKATGAQRAEAEAKLEEEQHAAQVAAEEEAAAEEAARLAALKAKQEQAEEAAQKQVADAEMEAKIAATKAAALEAVQATQKRAEDEINKREMDRLKSLHEELASKAQSEAEHSAASKKAKLADRIKAKRERKERDLKDREAAEVAALAAKQAAEAEEKERLRVSKMQWAEHLKEAADKATALGVKGAEYEDFLIQSTIGKQLVPPQHLAECVGLILQPRHHEETARLMEGNFDRRIGAVKAATDAVLEAKNLERVDTVERMKGEGKDDAEVDAAIADLDDRYSHKQAEAEKEAVRVLEEESMASQMKLRQTQLEEVSKLVGMHSDPETMKALAAKHADGSGGKSMIEEMSDYRAKLEKERTARAEAMAQEKEEEEARMKAKMDADMAAMRERLNAEAKAAEEEFAKRKAAMESEIEAQKKAMDAKAEAASNEVDKAAQAKIMEAFDKESDAALKALDNEKKKKKDKLAERLAAKRNKKKAAQKASGKTPPPTDALPSGIAESADAVAEAAGEGEGEGAGGTELDDEAVPGTSTGSSPEKRKKFSESKEVVKAIKKKSKAAAQAEGVSPALLSSLEQVVQRMDSIEGMLGAIQARGVPSTGAAPAAAAAASVPAAAPAAPVAAAPTAAPAAAPAFTFSDVTEPSAGTATALVEDRSLHLQQRAKMDFGRRLAGMLNMPEVEVVAASSLAPPSPPLAGFGTGGTGAGTGTITNPFAHSYAYDHTTKQLAIHTDRLGSSGDFGLVLVHALSHVKTNPYDITNDQDSAFMAEFYKNLKVLSQDLYREQSRGGSSGGGSSSSSSGDDGDGTSGSGSGTPKDKFKSIRKVGSKLLDITAAMGSQDANTEGADAKAKEEEAYYSSSSMASRLLEYAKTTGVSIPDTYVERYQSEEGTEAGAEA